MKLLWLPLAIEDFSSQIAYIEKNNSRASASQSNKIIKQIDQLLIYPEMGRPGRVKGTRELVINQTQFILIYRINVQRIELIRFLHGSQKFP